MSFAKRIPHRIEGLILRVCEKIIIGTLSVIQLGRSVIILVNVKSIGAFSLEIRL